MESILSKFICFLFFETVLGSVAAFPDSQRVKITSAVWDGVAAYIAVERQAVQKKLDAFHNITNNGQRAPKLYMPTTPVFYDKLTANHHVVYLDFGFADFIDFSGEPSISSYGSESSIIIPFLADSPDGVPKYALALGQLYQRDRGAISKNEIIFPYYDIDQLTVTETGALWKNGSEELRASFIKSNPCRAPPPFCRHEFDFLIDEELHFSFSEPDLDYCDRYSLVEDQVCDTLKSIRSDVEQALPNVCEFYQARMEGTCEASIDIVNITKGFRDLLLLKDDLINVVASESLFGDFDLGLKYPCL